MVDRLFRPAISCCKLHLSAPFNRTRTEPTIVTVATCSLWMTAQYIVDKHSNKHCRKSSDQQTFVLPNLLVKLICDFYDEKEIDSAKDCLYKGTMYRYSTLTRNEITTLLITTGLQHIVCGSLHSKFSGINTLSKCISLVYLICYR